MSGGGGGGETAAAGVLEDQMEKDGQPGPGASRT